jgi:hypothetical protein
LKTCNRKAQKKYAQEEIENERGSMVFPKTDGNENESHNFFSPDG